MQAKEPEQQLEELADILEAAYAFTAAKGFAKEELKKIRLEKTQRKGTFKGRIFLKKDQSGSCIWGFLRMLYLMRIFVSLTRQHAARVTREISLPCNRLELIA